MSTVNIHALKYCPFYIKLVIKGSNIYFCYKIIQQDSIDVSFLLNSVTFKDKIFFFVLWTGVIRRR